MKISNFLYFTKIETITLRSVRLHFVLVLCCSVMSNSATPWAVACQAPLSMGIHQARILEWVAMLSYRGSSQPRDQTQVSCIAGGYFTGLSHQGSPMTVFSSVQSLSCVQLFMTPWIAAPPCPLPTPGVHSNSCPLSQWCIPSNHLILCHLLLQKSFP